MAFLLRRNAIYHFRCRVPRDLINQIEHGEVRRSLDTADYRLAKSLAAVCYAAVQGVFERERKKPMDDKDTLIKEMGVAMDKAMAQLVKTTAQLLETQDTLHSTTETLATVVTDYGILSKQNNILTKAYTETKAVFDVAAKAIDGAYDLSAMDNDFIDKLVKERNQWEAAGKIKDAKETIGLMGDFINTLGLVISSTPAPSVSTFLETTYKLEKRLQDDGNRHITNYITMFARVTGNKPMNTYCRADIIQWVRVLEKMKDTIGKSPSDKNKSIKELLDESEGKPTLGETTIEKHILHVKAMFRCAIRHHKFAHPSDIDSMFDNIDLSDWVPKKQKRKIWKVEHLNALFQTPIWSGTRSRRADVTKRHQVGPNIYRDAYWWLPILALFTGARLEELAQLHHNDLDYDAHKTPFIKINDEGDKRIKTESSKRNVPVHPFLVSIGFLDLFRRDAKGSESRRIFPELKASGRLKKFGDMYSTHFTDYRRRTGTYEYLRDFHSFRRTFITMLRTKYDVHPLTVAAIVGHDDENPELKRVLQTDDYTDYNVSDLARVVSMLNYQELGVDMTMLLKTAKPL